jgi:hypothetical protein
MVCMYLRGVSLKRSGVKASILGFNNAVSVIQPGGVSNCRTAQQGTAGPAAGSVALCVHATRHAGVDL